MLQGRWLEHANISFAQSSRTQLLAHWRIAMLAVQSTKKFRECEAVESTRKWKCWMHGWPISETPTRNAFMTCPLQSDVSSKIMRLGNCASALTRYEYVNRTTKLRQTIQHEIATEHLIAHGCRLITAVSLHCKLSLTRLLQSIAVILYPHEYVEGFVYNESE